MPGGRLSWSAVAFQPVFPTGLDADTSRPGSEGTSANPPPLARAPVGHCASAVLCVVVSLALEPIATLVVTDAAGPGGPCGPARPAGPAGPGSPRAPVSPFGPWSPFAP